MKTFGVWRGHSLVLVEAVSTELMSIGTAHRAISYAAVDIQ